MSTIFEPPVRTTTNPHDVPTKAWDKWSMAGRAAFNELYDLMTGSPELFRHPDADEAPTEHWETTAWNAAWSAAAMVSAVTQ